MTTLFALLLMSSPVAAQSLSTGSIGGTVQSAGGPVQGAMLTLVHTVSGVARSVTPSGSGTFEFGVLPTGEYELRAEQFGYRPLLLTGVVVRPGQRLEVPVEMTAVTGPAERVDTLRLRGARLAGRSPGMLEEVGAGRLSSYPTVRRELADLARQSSMSSSDLEMQGLPAWLSGIRVDGMEVGTLESAALVPGSSRTAALPLAMFERGAVVATNPDVEWSSAGGAIEAFTARGGRNGGTEVFGNWGSDVVQGGVRVAGAVIPDTANFLIGLEASRFTRGAPFGGVADPEIDPVQYVAREVYGVGPGSETSSDRIAGFASLAWQLSENTQVDTRASFATLPTASGDFLSAPGAGIARPYDGRDFFIGTTLTSRLSRRVFQEFRLSVDGVSRSFDDADPLGLVTPTHILSTGSALGPEGIRPRSFGRTAVRASQTMHLSAGDHRLKAGIAGSIGWVSAEQGIMSETFFSDAEAFESGEAYVVRSEIARGRSEFRTPQAALFAQDTWTVSTGLDLLFGARLDFERLPTGEVDLNEEWLELTGLDNRNVASSWLRISPRVGFRWDLQDRHEWVVSGSGGIFSGTSDPLLLASWIAGDGSATVSRGTAAWNGWPSAPSTGQTAAPTLTLLNPDFRGPRTIRGDLGISRAIGSGTALHLAALYRHTDFLPRASDLNLAMDPVATDQFGRPIYGELRQQGGIVYALSGSNRRFDDFDQVIAIDVDGTSTYRGITAGLEHRAGERLEMFASYTFSRTEDNWSPTGFSAAGTDLAPRLGGGGDWMDGVSNFDVPHRAVAGVEVGSDALAGLRAAVLYRFASGRPFTPGFRAGVDANADGSSRNDPAFIHADVGGMEELLPLWSCLSEQTGAFAQRNSCRGEAQHAVDARLSLGFARFGRFSAALVVDALNLLASENVFHDTALYLVDPAGEIVRDGAGRVTIPLMANENFGRSIGPLQQGRSLRLGLRVSH
jgi:hypothetical protein